MLDRVPTMATEHFMGYLLNGRDARTCPRSIADPSDRPQVPWCPVGGVRFAGLPSTSLVPMARARTDETPDTVLIERCLEGDEAAWEALVGRYANLVYAIAARGGLSDDEVADAFQTVFVIVWRNLDLLGEPQAFAGWLATIARRETWRIVRGRKRREERSERMAADPSGDALPGRPADADEALDRAERAALVQQAVEGLDERCREMLTILFWEMPTPPYEEIAQRIGMPLGSLGPTRGRCLEKLRHRLEEAGFR